MNSNVPPPDLLVIDPLEWARDRPSLFFTDGIVTNQELLELLLAGARVLDARSVTAQTVDEWSVVAADEDWFHRGRFPIPIDLRFTALTPFPELGQNCVRPEVLVAVFSRDIVVLGPAGAHVAKGVIAQDDPFHAFLTSFPSWQRAVAFRGIGGS